MRGDKLSSSQRKLPMAWAVIFGVGTIAVLAAAIVAWAVPRLSENPGHVAAAALEEDVHTKVTSRFSSPSEEEALRIVKRALANRDENKVSAFFRMGTSSPREIIEFLGKAAGLDGAVSSYTWLSSLDADHLLLEGVLVRSKGVEKSTNRLVLLTPDESGNWKVDFDAYSRRAIPSWEELLEKNATGAIVRITVSKDVYYNGPFSDDKEWVSYKLSSPDLDRNLQGYCKVGSPLAVAMEKLFIGGTPRPRATLEISRVQDGGPLQFEITRLRSSDWVLPVDKDGGAEHAVPMSKTP